MLLLLAVLPGGHTSCQQPQKDLTKMPSDIPTDCIEVNLMGNKITELPSGGFSLLTQCTTLDLNFNKISVIQQNALNGLIKLKTLKLFDNEISVIGNGKFVGLNNLEELHLSYNKITLEVGSFSSLTQLIYLTLNWNDLTTIHSNTFKGLQNVQRLFLSNNEISIIQDEAFMELTNLQELHLYSDDLLMIGKWVNNGLRDLQLLTLTSNLFSHLEPGIFSSLTQLRFLSVIMCSEVGQISQPEQRPTQTRQHDLRILQGVFLLLFHHNWCSQWCQPVPLVLNIVRPLFDQLLSCFSQFVSFFFGHCSFCLTFTPFLREGRRAVKEIVSFICSLCLLTHPINHTNDHTLTQN